MENDEKSPLFPLDELVTSYATAKRLFDEALGEWRISFAAYRVLSELYREDVIAIKELAERCNVGASQLAVLLRELEREGYIFRRKNPADGRSRRICLSDQAMKRRAESDALQRKTSEQLIQYGRFTPSEIAHLSSLLLRLSEALGHPDAEL
jgi:DNA-binding MarR family transcriptional regulator